MPHLQRHVRLPGSKMMVKDPGEKTLTPPPHSPSQKWCIEDEGNIYATRSCCLDTAYSPSQKHTFLNRPIGPLPPGMYMVRVGTRCRGSHHFSMSFACHECLRSSKANACRCVEGPCCKDSMERFNNPNSTSDKKKNALLFIHCLSEIFGGNWPA